MARLYAGTSGFAYPSWKPDFYPPDVPTTRFLEHYAGRLNCVEVNYSFRRTPKASTLQDWIERTPPGFLFAMKAHQRITHLARLKDAAESTEFFLSALAPLRDAGRLGPVLFQLPPNLRLDLPRLEAYLPLLPRDLRATFEFRDPSWFTDDVYGLLRDHGVALCVAQTEELDTPEVVTADFAYFRLRRPDYSRIEIAGFVAHARELLAQGLDVYMVFKHEETAAGALRAEEVLKAA